MAAVTEDGGMPRDLQEAILSAVEALGLLMDEESARRDLVRLLRDTANKPTQRAILIDTLKCCARLPNAEPFLQIEAEAREAAEGIRKRAEANARNQAAYTIDRARFQADNILGDATGRMNRLKAAEEDCERRRQEMMSPHAPAIALLQTILEQYPVQHGDRLPPTAFLSACALVASLMGTNPVDLALNLSGGSFEFNKRK
jgi:hypothetical protein